MPRTRTGRYGALVAASLLAAVAVGGCQGNPKPPPLVSSSPTPSPSTSPTPTPPALPAEAQGTSEASAKAFVRHYIEVLNYAGPAGDTASLRTLSTEACVSCTAIADFIDDVTSSGGSIAGKGWSVLTVRVIYTKPRQNAVVDAVVNVNPQTVRTSASSEPKKFEGGRRSKTFWLVQRKQGWVITRLDQPE